MALDTTVHDLNWDNILCVLIVVGTAVGIWVRLRHDRKRGGR